MAEGEVHGVDAVTPPGRENRRADWSSAPRLANTY